MKKKKKTSINTQNEYFLNSLFKLQTATLFWSYYLNKNGDLGGTSKVMLQLGEGPPNGSNAVHFLFNNDIKISVITYQRLLFIHYLSCVNVFSLFKTL